MTNITFDQFETNYEDINLESGSGYQAKEPGEYEMFVSDAETKETSSGGTMLILTISASDGSFIKQNYNIVNSNPIAQKIGLEGIQKIAKAIGLGRNPKNVQEIMNRKFVAVLGYEEKQQVIDKVTGKPQIGVDGQPKYYPLKNKILQLKEIQQGASNAGASSQTSTQKPAWRR